MGQEFGQGWAAWFFYCVHYQLGSLSGFQASLVWRVPGGFHSHVWCLGSDSWKSGLSWSVLSFREVSGPTFIIFPETSFIVIQGSKHQCPKRPESRHYQPLGLEISTLPLLSYWSNSHLAQQDSRAQSHAVYRRGVEGSVANELDLIYHISGLNL